MLCRCIGNQMCRKASEEQSAETSSCPDQRSISLSSGGWDTTYNTGSRDFWLAVVTCCYVGLQCFVGSTYRTHC